MTTALNQPPMAELDTNLIEANEFDMYGPVEYDVASFGQIMPAEEFGSNNHYQQEQL